MRPTAPVKHGQRAMVVDRRIGLSTAGGQSVAFLVIASLVIGACSLSGSPPSPIAVVSADRQPTEAATPIPSPSAASSPGCYYAWATQELPELSDLFQKQIAGLDPGIVASAYAFGEECREDDGTSTFLPMETDFRARVPVRAFSEEEALGKWIRRVMEVVASIPAAELAGPRPGRVEFEFVAADSTSLRLTVEVARFLAETEDLDGAALFRHFHPGPD